ncbi:MAG: YcxB family protein [Desulfuromonas sp.]|nr:YcxB family protein [Desulfuromonas sp.]
MPESITLSYPLSKELWRLFFVAHYSCDRGLKLCSVLGAVCIIIGALGLAGFYPSQIVAALLLVTGLFGLLSKQLLVFISLHKASCHPFFGQQLTVTISAQEILVHSGNSGYSQPWNNFIGYRQFEPGFALYHDQHAFFFIPASAMSGQDTTQLEQMIETAALPRL